jgi:L-gulono-1,4-lactone dehydrogenase
MGIAAPAQDAAAPDERGPLTNFGGNQTCRPLRYRPRNDEDVLAILERHSHGQVRPFGSLHSWSDVAVSSGVALDMSAFDQVRPFTQAGETFAEVGAGLRLQEVLDRLHKGGHTLPTLGAIKRQTISGAISTGTHGSGRQSLSHFVTAVRVAAYDASGRPKIITHRDGNALKAARCALGCMGAILSVEVSTVPQYMVKETVTRHATLDDVLSRYPEQPLTQFVLTPHRWAYVAWERRPVEKRARSRVERLTAWLFRAYNTVGVDVLFHFLLKASLGTSAAAVKMLLRIMPHLLIANVARVDYAEHVLTLGHHYFRHEEMELFVTESRLREAVELLRCATAVFAGDTASVSSEIEAGLRLHNLHGELIRHTGSYVHHYPYFFRRILPEGTLISMASSLAEPMYSISVFTYVPPHKRQPYYDFCSWLARAMNRLFDARLHWGKHFPLTAAEIARLYPNLATFSNCAGRPIPPACSATTSPGACWGCRWVGRRRT